MNTAAASPPSCESEYSSHVGLWVLSLICSQVMVRMESKLICYLLLLQSVNQNMIVKMTASSRAELKVAPRKSGNESLGWHDIS
jgi:hypothetical protein